MKKLTDRDLTKVYKSKVYGEYTIVKYNDWHNVTIQFSETKYSYVTALGAIKAGRVKDLYFPSVFGIGYIGEGNYTPCYKRGGRSVNTRAYTAWTGRLRHCYGPKDESSIYFGSTVCTEWHNFQNFAKWYYEQEKLYGKAGYVDKDLCFLGSKHYSPETARYVPQEINALFGGATGNIKGVHFCNKLRKYVARIYLREINSKGKRNPKYLGSYTTYEQAEQVYITAKIAHVRETALKYQEQLPPDLFYKLYTGAENYVYYYMNQKENNNDD